VTAARRREEFLDREVVRLREKLETKQRAIGEIDEQLNSRNVELVFLAGQLVKVSEGRGSLTSVVFLISRSLEVMIIILSEQKWFLLAVMGKSRIVIWDSVRDVTI